MTDHKTGTRAEWLADRLEFYHFMFGPEYTAGCPSCSASADGFDGSVVHLAVRTVPGPTSSHRASSERTGRRTGEKVPA